MRLTKVEIKFRMFPSKLKPNAMPPFNTTFLRSHSLPLCLAVSFTYRELERCQVATAQAKETYVRLRKERDFHRMHHKRVLQEKSKLIADLQRVQVRFRLFISTLFLSLSCSKLSFVY